MPKWVRRYAHNRSLPILVNLGLFLLAGAVIAGSSTLAGRELEAGHKAAGLALGALALAACAVWVWLVATPRLARLSSALVIHAVLALAGVRPFSGEPNAATILVPTFGYGVIAAMASHVYSRVALRRLRSLARDLEADETGGRRHA